MAGTFRIEGSEELKAALRQFPEAAKRGGRRGLIKGSLRVQRDARDAAPVDTGRLRASIEYQVQTMMNGVRAIIGTAVKYAKYREFGTRPHFVPVRYIGRWAELHGLGHRGVFVSGRATPFLMPAAEANQHAVINDVITEVRAEIERLSR